MSEWSLVSGAMDKERRGNFSLLVNDVDNDGDTLHAELVDGPSMGTLKLEDDGSFSYVAGPDFIGDSFTYRVSDGESASAPVVVIIDMLGNIDPVAADDVYRVSTNGVLEVKTMSYGIVINGPQAGRKIRFDEPVHFGEATLAAYMGLTRDPSLMTKLTDRIDVLYNDNDGDNEALHAELGTDVQHGTLQLNSNGTFTYTPYSWYSGDDNFTYRATDGRGWSDFATVTIHVANTPPHADDIEYSTPHNKALVIGGGSWAAMGLGQSLAKAVTDDERQTLTIEKVSEPAHGTLELTEDGGFTYTPDQGFIGIDTFLFSAFDGAETSNIATATIRVTNVRPTVPISHETSVIRNKVLTAALPAATDPDGDALVPELVTAPHGTLVLNGDSTFTYTPNTNFLGADVVA